MNNIESTERARAIIDRSAARDAALAGDQPEAMDELIAAYIGARAALMSALETFPDRFSVEEEVQERIGRSRRAIFERWGPQGY